MKPDYAASYARQAALAGLPAIAFATAVRRGILKFYLPNVSLRKFKTSAQASSIAWAFPSGVPPARVHPEAMVKGKSIDGQ